MRPHPGETVSGDDWLLQWHGDTCRVTLVDGVGHGDSAAFAAKAARDALEKAPHLAPEDALRACHAAIDHSRGAVAAVAAIDVARSHMTFSGIGNIEARIWQGEREQRMFSYRGIIGATIPTPRSTEVELVEPWTLIMHSDGVSARFSLKSDALHEFQHRDPQALADLLLERWARAHDDATVVVVRSAPTGG